MPDVAALQGDLHCALLGLCAAGVSDWADGYVAKKTNAQSVLGSYLDPLADKVTDIKWGEKRFESGMRAIELFQAVCQALKHWWAPQ